MRQSGQEYHYLYDGKGNVSAVIDSTQTVVASYRYDTFGRLTTQSGTLDQPYRFSTKQYLADVGLNYYGYRFYSPAMGRWMNRDPLGEEGGINLYAFVQNNPVNSIDPLGLWNVWGGTSGVAAWGIWGKSAGSGMGWDSDGGLGGYITNGSAQGAGLSVGYEVGFYTGSISGETEVATVGFGPLSLGYVTDYQGNWGIVGGFSWGFPVEATVSNNNTIFYPINPCP